MGTGRTGDAGGVVRPRGASLETVDRIAAGRGAAACAIRAALAVVEVVEEVAGGIHGPSSIRLGVRWVGEVEFSGGFLFWLPQTDAGRSRVARRTRRIMRRARRRIRSSGVRLALASRACAWSSDAGGGESKGMRMRELRRRMRRTHVGAGFG